MKARDNKVDNPKKKLWKFKEKLRALDENLTREFTNLHAEVIKYLRSPDNLQPRFEPPSIYRTPCLMGIIPITRSYDEQQQLHKRI